MKENIKKTTLPASPTNGNMIGMYAIDLGVQNPHWQIVSKELYDKEPEHRRLIVNMEANHIGLQNAPVSDTTGSDSKPSADNQTSQIADKDWREELSRLKEENERLRYKADKLNYGREYLMGVNSKKLTVEDALEAFGFGRSGLEF